MRIHVSAKVTVLAKHVTTGKDNKEFYNIAIDDGSGCESVSCTKECFDVVQTGREQVLAAVYDTKYTFLRFVGVEADAPAKR